MSDDIFVNDDTFYINATNKINPVKDYIIQTSNFISKVKNISIEEAKKIVLEKIKNKKDIINPKVRYRHMLDNGDREISETTLLDYLKIINNGNKIIAPSLTTYTHPKDNKSVHAVFLENNTAKRKKHKKLAFKYRQEGNDTAYKYHNSTQKAMKINNNSVSGGYANKGTILYNPSAHYTLTSTTRCVSSIGNCLCENIIAGNFMFTTPEIVYNYIAVILTNTKISDVELAITKYNLYIPNVEDILYFIKRSSNNYWKSTRIINNIRDILNTLDYRYLTAILYTNNLWDIKEHNENLIRDIIDSSIKILDNISDEQSILSKSPEYIQVLLGYLCSDYIKGKSINYNSIEDYDLRKVLVSTSINLNNVFSKYRTLFKTFFITKTFPIRISYVKDLYRKTIVLSDTDSTCASYDKWVKWYYNKEHIATEESMPASAIIMTIVSQTLDHLLKIFSRNLNCDKVNLNTLQMKNEFYWSSFTVSNVAKHYFANIIVQEGNVFKEPDLELKGVHLIASNANLDITTQIKNLIKDINYKLYLGQQISVNYYIKEVAKLERLVLNKIENSDSSIFRRDRIKDKTAYKQEEALSPYIQYLLWKEVFSSKYGKIDKPPYSALKIPTILDNTKIRQEFIDNLEDSIREKYLNFIHKYNKNAIITFRIPTAIVNSVGIPKEIIPYIDKDRIVKDNMYSAYLVLETLGVYRKENLLIKDIYLE